MLNRACQPPLRLPYKLWGLLGDSPLGVQMEPRCLLLGQIPSESCPPAPAQEGSFQPLWFRKCPGHTLSSIHPTLWLSTSQTNKNKNIPFSPLSHQTFLVSLRFLVLQMKALVLTAALFSPWNGLPEANLESGPGLWVILFPPSSTPKPWGPQLVGGSSENHQEWQGIG